MEQYESVIGLEVHVELSTNSKIFCGCATQFGGEVNTKVCPVCLGMPGTLPVLNKKVVEYAIAVGLATNCTISECSRFDRKNYFYPDNPQNYQISQLYSPICTNGYIDIKNKKDNNVKRIGIHEIHMEEDAGKLIHDDVNNISMIDYNRAGIPLIEIVTEPDMSSAEEVILFLEKLRYVIQYLGVSDCKLNEGSMRVDVNQSIRKVGDKSLGVRTEMKNLNSFKAITKAIEHERDRQICIIKEGKTVIQETRRWDEDSMCSYSMRSKEDSNDYRYFPEPDLKPIFISKEWIDNIKEKQPEFRDEKINRYIEEYNIPEYDIDIITSNIRLSDMFERLVDNGVTPKKASNWLMVDVFKCLNDRNMDINDIPFNASSLSELISLVEYKKITKTTGIDVLNIMFEEDITPSVYVEENELKIVDNDEELHKVIEDVFKNNPKSLEDYKNGKNKVVGYLVGQTMKAMKGMASPEKVNYIIADKLKSM